MQKKRGEGPDAGGFDRHISHKHYPSSSPEPQSAVSLASNQSDRVHQTDYPAEMGDAPDIEKLAPNAPAKPPGGEEEDLFQPKSLKFWLTLLCNFLALFLVALDRTIIATAVPQITDDFHSLGDIGWYGSAYMLTTSCSQLLYGRIYKFYDTKWVFLISVVIFEVGSAICGVAPNSVIFIVGRAIAGLASAGIFSGTMLIMIPMVPLHRRPMFQGMFGMVFGLASVMGPLIGGGFTSGATWRWCFYINLPIGAVSLIFMIFFWHPPRQKYVPAPFWTHVKRLDPLGMLFFLPSLVSLLLALQWGGSTYKWKNWRIVMLFGIFGMGFILFVVIQLWRPDTATVPARIITQRSVAFGTGFTFFLSGSMLILVYYVPIWFQTVQQVIPLKSGVYTMPLVLSLVASSFISGVMTQKIGYYVPAMILAPSIMAVGEGLMTTWTRSTPSSQWIAYQFLAGFGLGFGMQTSGLAVQTVLPPADISTGIAINFFVQQLGGAVFTSVGQAILSNILVAQLSGIPGLEAQQIINEGATNLSSVVPPEFFDLVINAYNYACTRIFIASMGLAFASLICACAMEWRSIKKGRQGPPGGPGGPKGPPGGPASGPAPEPSGKSTSSSADLIKSAPDPALPPQSQPLPQMAPVEGRRLSAERQRDQKRRRSTSLKRGMDRRDFIPDQRHSRGRVEASTEQKRSGDGENRSSAERVVVENVYRPSPSKVVVPTEYRRSVDRSVELPAGRSDFSPDYHRSPPDRVEREFKLSIGRPDPNEHYTPYTRSADRIEVPPEYRRSMGRVDDWRRSIDHMEMPTNARSADRLDNPAPPRRSMDNRGGRDRSKSKPRDINVQADLEMVEKTPAKKSPAKGYAPNTSETRRSSDRRDQSTGRRSRDRRRSISGDRERRRSVLVKRDRRLSSSSNLGDESDAEVSTQRLPKLYSNRDLPPGAVNAVLGVRNYSYETLPHGR
ncbi:MFS general substrate transporter [Thozetella sp. PMI_491]|nr:MFS general substrate transporter [Thozetella sp. PMI_491]